MKYLFNLFFLFVGVCIVIYPFSAFSQNVKFNNGAYLVSQNASYWVFDNGSFNIQSDNDSKPLSFGNLKITNDASINVLSETNITINDSLINQSNNLTLKSDNLGTASLITYGKITGVATVEKFLTSTNPSGHTLSSPVKHAAQNLFSDAINTYYYNPLQPSWVVFSTGELEKMRGYWTKFSNDKTISFNDTLNTGIFTYTDFYRIAPYGYGNMGWNFLGNPYPSAISWDSVININGGTQDFKAITKLNNALHVINDNGNYDSYVYFVGTNGFKGIVPPHKAFWTQVSHDYYDSNNPLLPVSGANLNLDNSVRVHENLVPVSKSTLDGIIRLNIERNQGKDEAILRLVPNATFNFDPAFDAYKFISESSHAPQIYMATNAQDKMAINSLPDNPNLPVSIPLGIVSAANQLHTLSIDLSAFNKDNINVHLEDKIKNTFTDVRQSSNYNYMSFTGTDTQRFVLHLGLNTNTNLNENSQQEVDVYSYDNSIYIGNLKENVTFSLYDMLGKLVFSENLTDSNTKFEFNLPRAYYIVRLTGNKTNTVKKVLINSNHY